MSCLNTSLIARERQRRRETTKHGEFTLNQQVPCPRKSEYNRLSHFLLPPENDFHSGCGLTFQTVLITGASRGTGLEAARQLAAKGANVMMVARDAERLRDGVNSLKTAALSPETQRFQFIPAELMDAEACAQVMSDNEMELGAATRRRLVFRLCSIPTPLGRYRRLTTSSTDGRQIPRKRIHSPRSIENVAKRGGRTGRRGDNEKVEDCHKATHLHFFLSSSMYNGWIHVLYGPAKGAARSLSDCLS